jgi:hypothetical protein
MRRISLLIAGAVLASCTTAPPPPQGPTPKQIQEYQRLVSGKIAQPPISCLPNLYSNDMITIDGHTLGFRLGQSRSYIVHLSGGCEPLETGSYALVSRQPGGMGMCRGDIEQVVDVSTHTQAGSCTVVEVVPYYRR